MAFDAAAVNNDTRVFGSNVKPAKSARRNGVRDVPRKGKAATHPVVARRRRRVVHGLWIGTNRSHFLH